MKIVKTSKYRPCIQDAAKQWPKIAVEHLVDGNMPLPCLDAVYRRIMRISLNWANTSDSIFMALSEFTYGVESFYVENGAFDYATAFSFARQMGYETFVDVGCADGIQSELIYGTPMQYIGIEPSGGIFWRPGTNQYIREKFPCTIPVTKKVLGASRLCTGYLMTDYASIAEKFNDFLLDGPIEAAVELSRYYRTVHILHDDRNPNTNGWIWFHDSNKIGREETEHA